MARLVTGGQGQQSLDRLPAVALPGQDARVAERVLRHLRVDARDASGRKGRERRNVHLGRIGRGLPDEADPGAAGVDVRLFEDGIRFREGADAPVPDVESIEEGGDALRLEKVERRAVGRPARDLGILVEGVRQVAAVSAIHRSQADPASVRPARRVVGHDVGDPPAVGRVDGLGLGGARAGEGPHGSGGDVDERDVGGGPLVGGRPAAVGEGDRLSVRGPVELVDRADLRHQLFRLARLAGAIGDGDDPEADRPVVGTDHVRVVSLAFAPFPIVGIRLRSEECDRAPVGRPRGPRHVRLRIRQSPRLAAVGREQPDVREALAPPGEKRDPPAVRRPPRAVGRLVREGGGPRGLSVRGREPDLLAILAPVLLHDGLAHDERDAAAVGRDPDVGDRAVREHVGDRPVSRRVRSRRRSGAGGGGRGEEERQDADGGDPGQEFLARPLTRSGRGPCAPSDRRTCSRTPSRTREASTGARSPGTATADEGWCSSGAWRAPAGRWRPTRAPRRGRTADRRSGRRSARARLAAERRQVGAVRDARDRRDPRWPRRGRACR